MNQDVHFLRGLFRLLTKPAAASCASPSVSQCFADRLASCIIAYAKLLRIVGFGFETGCSLCGSQGHEAISQEPLQEVSVHRNCLLMYRHDMPSVVRHDNSLLFAKHFLQGQALLPAYLPVPVLAVVHVQRRQPQLAYPLLPFAMLRLPGQVTRTQNGKPKGLHHTLTAGPSLASTILHGAPSAQGLIGNPF